MTRRTIVISACAASILALTAIAAASRGGAPTVSMGDVTTGPFIDIVEIRGEIRPFKSLVVTAPLDAGQLQIVTIVRDGTRVKKGDVLVEFDPSTPRAEMLARTTELKQAQAQVDQQKAEARISRESNSTALLKADYDVRRAKLDLSGEEFIPKIDVEISKLLLKDAEQRLIEMQAKVDADNRASAETIARAERRVERIQMDIDRRKQVLANLQLRAPSDGVVSIMLNPRNSSPMQPPQEFRPGDQAWPGAQLIELPDLSSVHLLARVEESDRGRVQTGQRATIRVDAIPGSNLEASLTSIALLARPDFSTGFPPGRNFDMKITVAKTDDRLRPGQSATARVEVGRIENATLVPAGAIFNVNGRPTIYKLDGRAFEPVVVEVLRRGREYAAVKSGVAAGDKVALVDPTETPEGGAQ
jgi:multidrug efflux pump subunit AcrA (membrane-fusion protein)